MVLVTGGAGFIGSHLVEALLNDGYRVRVVDNLATGHRSNLAHLEGRYEWFEGDLADFDACRQAAEGSTYVFHQGAIPSVPRSVREPLESHRERPDGDAQHARGRAAGGGAAVHVRRVQQRLRRHRVELPKHEGMFPSPLSPYAAGKLAGEYYVSVYAQTMGLDGVSLRYFNIFGPRQDPSSPYSGVISLFIKFMSQGQRPTIYGDGSQTRDFTYVANAVAANLAAMRRPEPLGGQVFNVGTGQRISLLDLVAALNTIFGTSLEPDLPGHPRAGDVRDSLASLERIKEASSATSRWCRSRRDCDGPSNRWSARPANHRVLTASAHAGQRPARSRIAAWAIGVGHDQTRKKRA